MLRRKRLVIAFIFLSILFISAYLLVPHQFSLFIVKNVYVSAPDSLFPNIDYFQKQRNLLWFSDTEFTHELKQVYPMVVHATVRKSLPNSLYIEVDIDLPVMRVTQENGDGYVNASGIFFKDLPHSGQASLPLLKCDIGSAQVGKKIPREELLPVFQMMAKLNADVKEHINVIHCREDDVAQIEFSDSSILVDFSLSSDPGQTASSLQYLRNQFRIDSERPKRVDLRFEKPVLIFTEEPVASMPTGVAP